MLWKNSLAGRIVIGTGLALAVTGIILFARPEILSLLVAAWVVLATAEFLQLLRRVEIKLNFWLIPVLNFAIALAGHLGWLPGFLLAPIAIVFITATTARPALPRIPVYSTFALIYLGFLPSHLILLNNLIQQHHLSRWLVLFPLVLTWTNDTAAYAVGRLLGRHKLAAALSPKKTVEGFIAGLVAATLLSALWLKKIPPFASQPWWWLGLLGTGLGAIAQAGDLFESLFKRAAGQKDSATTLGEHGGFLDRADSLIFTIPAFYYLTLLIIR